MKIKEKFDKYLSNKRLIKGFTLLYIVLFGLLALTNACLNNITIAEPDSLILPTVSLQYRGSIIISESDFSYAKIDFPEVYGSIDPSNYTPINVVPVKERSGEWLSSYFPIYSMVCLPIKVFLQFVGLPQIRSFPITNAILVILALVAVFKFLKVSDGEKLLIVLLLTFSPIILHISSAMAESMIFSLVTIALVLYHEHHYKSSAILIVLAGWENPTIMAFGAVMIVNFLIDTVKADIKKPVREIISRNYGKVIKLALCYVWCFVPFIFNRLYSGTINSTFGMADLNDWGGRFVEYFFDYNLGFTSFAPFLVVFAVITLPFCIAKKNYPILYCYASLLLTVAAFSVARHINCGMIFCARYVMWSYPFLVFICVKNGKLILKNKILYKSVNVILVFSCLFFTMWGTFYEEYSPYKHNAFAKTILDNAPQLYNPIPSTFYCRTRHVDGGYWETGICVYYDSDNEARKILLFGSKSEKLNLLNNVIVSGNSDAFIEKVNSVPNDGKYHYINIGKNSDYSVKEANKEERGVIAEKAVLTDNHNLDVSLSGFGETQAYPQAIQVKPYTCYKISFSFDDESVKKYKDISRCYVDIYDPDGRYDRREQQVELQPEHICADNTVFICTDDIPEGTDNVQVRIVMVSESPVTLTDFSVTEMRYSNNCSQWLSGDKRTEVISESTVIKPFTDYIVTVNCDDYQLKDDEVLFVDLYGGGDYDNDEQQRYLTPGKVNSFVVNSGDISAVNGNVSLRVVAVTESPIFVSVPNIQEADRLYGGGEFDINFTGDDYNADKFVSDGISHMEDGFSWTLGDSMHIEIPVYGDIEKAETTINVAGTFGEQSYIVWQNGNKIASGTLNGAGNINFTVNVTDGVIEFELELPDSKIVNQVNPESTDERQIALQIYKIDLCDAA